MTARTIDLNCDMGERDGPDGAADDLALLGFVTSASIACAGHAGDLGTMRATARAAIARGVALGAHPGYPDRANFGRVEMRMTPEAIEESVAVQITALDRIVRALGARLRHVKPHGALYHACSARPEVARAIARAAERAAPGLILVGQAGLAPLDVWRDMGRPVAPEAFADRRYEPGGTLRSRTLPDALLTSPKDAADQALRIVRGDGVVAADGSVVPLAAETICIHGDTPGAVRIAQAVRGALERAGITLRALREPDEAAP